MIYNTKELRKIWARMDQKKLGKHSFYIYLQITNRCNMQCSHCMFNCGPNGVDMDMRTVRKSLSLMKSISPKINTVIQMTIGGGEPTIHPHFMEILNLFAAYYPYIRPGVVTNGKNTRVVMKLLDWGVNNPQFPIKLSLDQYHEPIPKETVDLWRQVEPTHENIWIDDEQEYTPYNFGRAVENYGVGSSPYCRSNGLFIDPTGAIWQCGCMKKSFGTVFEPKIPNSYYELGEVKCSDVSERVTDIMKNDKNDAIKADLFISETFIKPVYDKEKMVLGTKEARKRASERFKTARAAFDEATNYKHAHEKHA